MSKTNNTATNTAESVALARYYGSVAVVTPRDEDCLACFSVYLSCNCPEWMSLTEEAKKELWESFKSGFQMTH
jgi:hypothetical protein